MPIWEEEETTKAGTPHTTLEPKLHWQLQANDQACTPSFEHK